MSRDQVLTLSVLAGLVVLFLSDRLRYDLVALLALLAAVTCGIVPEKQAFSGFANPVLPLIAAALVVSVAIGQSGAIEILLRWLKPALDWRGSQVAILVACVTLLSAFVKNIGALAIFIPAAIQVARRNKRSPSEFLMPLSFGSLIGGSMTLIGTSPNLLISAVREQVTGQPFHMFDFTPVSGGIAVCGVVFLAFGWRLLPAGLRGTADTSGFTVEDYTSELRVGANSSFVGRSVGEVEDLSRGAVSIAGLLRKGKGRQIPSRRWKLQPGDVLVVEADPQAIEQVARDGNLDLIGTEKRPEKMPNNIVAAAAKATSGSSKKPPAERPPPDEHELTVVEAVVVAGSDLIGRSASELRLRDRYGVNVVAIGRSGRLNRNRLRSVRFRLGDAVVLQGHTARMPDILLAMGCLPLAERELRLGQRRRLVLPLMILGLAVVASGLELVPVEIAFVAAAVAMVLFGLLSLKEAYAAIEWPILVLLGCLIPIGEAVQHTGTAGLIAASLLEAAAHLPGVAVLAALLVVTMLVTPVLHHAAAVLVMGPIAASLAKLLGYQADPFLIAVALGAGSDFLSPIGHQSNTLVMGLGGYRFRDYGRLGFPLSLIVIVLGVPLILFFWPLR